jgi:hypothetical protein
MKKQTNKIQVEIPERTHWIYKNPKALAFLIRGIEDAKAGRITDRGSFAKYAKENGVSQLTKTLTEEVNKITNRAN